MGVAEQAVGARHMVEVGLRAHAVGDEDEIGSHRIAQLEAGDGVALAAVVVVAVRDLSRLGVELGAADLRGVAGERMLPAVARAVEELGVGEVAAEGRAGEESPEAIDLRAIALGERHALGVPGRVLERGAEHGQAIVVVVEEAHDRSADLAEMAGAAQPIRGLLGARERRHEQRRENHHDGDHDHELDEREATRGGGKT